MISPLKDKRVLITGASGFIGGHLCDKLFDLGAHVAVTVHENPVDHFFHDGIPCDLQDYKQVENAVLYSAPEYVFHLASQAIVQDGTEFPTETINTNAMGSVNLFAALDYWNNCHKKYSLHRVIVASTDKVYGRHNYLPYEETFALLGTQQIYETSKNCEDILAQAYAHSYGLPIAITRFGNVYGPGDFHFSRLIPGVIDSYLQGISPIIRSNGQQYRDYVYIDDVVDAYIKLAEAEFLQENPAIYNFGCGFGSRVMDIVAMIAEHFPNADLPTITYGAKDEIEKQYLDSAKARNDLGWKPETKLRDGIAKTVEFWKDKLDD